MLDIKDTLRRLCETPGVSGYEGKAAAAARELLEPLVERTESDRLGNVLGYLPAGEPDAPTLLLDAHLDEVGLMVTAEEEGFYLFRSIGGVDSRILPAQTVTLLTDPPVTAVVATLPPHIQTAAEQKNVAPLTELYLDTGGISVPIGTLGVYESTGFMLGDKQYCSKSLDDRACFVTLLRALELLPAIELLRGKKRKMNLVICGSAQEEVGGRGVGPAAFSVEPDYAIAVDVTFGKSPDASEGTFILGCGPVICVGTSCNRRLTDKLIDVAVKQKLPYEIEVYARDTGTNGEDIMLTRGGIPTAVLGLPLKYMHTMAEVLHLDDIENTARLIAEWIVDFGDGTGETEEEGEV